MQDNLEQKWQNDQILSELRKLEAKENVIKEELKRIQAEIVSLRQKLHENTDEKMLEESLTLLYEQRHSPKPKR